MWHNTGGGFRRYILLQLFHLRLQTIQGPCNYQFSFCRFLASPPFTDPVIGSMSPKIHRKGSGQENYMKARYVSERPPSFNVRDGGGGAVEVLSRPRTVPDILAGKRVAGLTFHEDLASKGKPLKPTKLLLKVTIERSLGPVQVVMSPEGSVKDLIDAVLLLYVKEGRRPLLPSTAAADFELHYTQFSLESLKVEEKLMTLGSRNFFLCRNTASVSGGAPPTSSCSRAAKKQGLPWLKFMDFNF